ncbi:MAG: 23S rRNA (guanosine2251-2'-O)-methyltransferase [Puniceicoccaceae bacterium 5H]|nr:MAG: 23S rRNA (guanosine2251-2'-O)-methyltransferase [Puniceicoccaceae bacterium 5H]
MAKSSREFLYGLNPAFECLRAGRRKVYDAYLNEQTYQSGRLSKLHDLLQRQGVPVELVDKGRLIQLSGTREHQGVVLRTGTYPYVRFEEVFETQHPRLLLLDNVEDPHNVGAILRSAEIFGFTSVLLPTKGVPEVYPSVVKVSAGAAEFMQIAKDCTANKYVQLAQEAGYQVAALDAKGSIDLRDLAKDVPEKLLLVIGGEDKSVGQFILNKAEHIVRVEQQGKINSLNAGVAAGIAMFALSGQ